MLDLNKYNGNLDWLNQSTFYVTQHGSRAYGTNGPDSDYDYKGIFIAPIEYQLGFSKHINQVDKGFEDDVCLYEIRRFFQLAAQNNPNILEVLYTDPSCWERSAYPWPKIQANRDLFLSKNVKYRFSGYAVAQLKRILTHRNWLLNPPKHEPTREEYGLKPFSTIPKEQLDAASSQIRLQMDAWELDWDLIEDKAIREAFKYQWADSLAEMQLYQDNIFLAAANKVGLSENFMEILKAERAYRTAHQQWKQYQEWLRSRNPARAELERKYLYDTKSGYHLVRLLKMAREMLEGKGVLVKRPDAEELKDIRFRGAWSFDEIVTFAQKQDSELDLVMKESKLPKNPAINQLDQLCVDLIKETL